MKAKNYFLFTLITIFISVCFANGQTLPIQNQRILFNYDNSGNRVSREIFLIKPIITSDVSNNDTLELYNSNALAEETQPFSDKIGSDNIKIYPNPTRGQLKIEFLTPIEPNRIRISVFCSSGKLVYQKTMLQNPEMVDLSDQVNGIYLMVIENEVNKVTWRIIKQ